MNNSQHISNYDMQADLARTIFLTYDQEKLIGKFHLEADADWIYIEYLHTPCRISRADGHIEERAVKQSETYEEELISERVTEEKSVDISEQTKGDFADDTYRVCSRFHTVMTIYDLLCHAKGEAAPALSGDWCTVGHFVVGSSPQASVFTKRYETMFAGRAEELKAACERLGGVLQKRVAGADVTCEFAVTPYFPLRLQFWDGDEEFAPRISVLWDRNAMAFLHFETTYYLQQDLLERLGAHISEPKMHK